MECLRLQRIFFVLQAHNERSNHAIYVCSIVSPYPSSSFEQFCLSCKNHTRFIPLTFLLGFYVSQVFSRWWMQFSSLCGPDTIAMKLAIYCPGEKSRELKRNFMRYINAAFVITLRAVSKRHRIVFQIWRAWSNKVANFNSANGRITVIAWVNMPLAYTQVLNLFSLMYDLKTYVITTEIFILDGDDRGRGLFVLILFARQVLAPASENFETLGLKNNQQTEWYTVIIVLFEFFFYQGWLKVAESMFNPWGEDDDDFEVGYLWIGIWTSLCSPWTSTTSKPNPILWPNSTNVALREKIAIIENNGDPFPSPKMKALDLKNGNQALYYDPKKESIEMEEIGGDEKA
ncbi:bestrophin-1-like [Tigriopus californicus]|uniref:bestrophin-1-like n=1 Tax=Tigriopus californicus TaxID=6832 RepID=UPI0027DAA79A|nr:bestrophin-1-like [Tigriopus californicus]